MKIRHLTATPAIIALGAALIAAWGCNKKPNVPIVIGNRSPEVRITSAPLDTTARNYYVITLNWIGFDPDGRVDHFLLAIDPPKDPGSDTLWETTTENQTTRSFPSPLPDRRDITRSSDFHVFVIKAVDNLGAVSPPVARAFWSYTVAPRVEVRVPRANSLVTYNMPPAMLFRWEGFDDDGVFTQKPVQYKFKMLDDGTEVTLETIRTSGPDSVRRYYAPRHWAGWDSVGGDTTEKQFAGLDPGKQYVFVVVAFDEAGAHSPIFSFNTNMIQLVVTYSGAQNPIIGLFNDFFLYEYLLGAWRPGDINYEIPLEVPAALSPEDRLTFNWYAHPLLDREGNPLGGPIRSYRWAVDIVDLEDETPRSNQNDLAHWSQKNTLVTSCRIGPYYGGQVHKFYLEVEDINNLKSLGVVRFTTVRATFDKPLLIVNDTRLLLDEKSSGQSCVKRPIGNWPAAAELDTFLYAVGGKPWKCYPPVNGQTQLSSPGIFNGYEFDTLGTRLGIADLSIRLSRLGQYRHVLWLTDGVGALNDNSGSDVANSQTSMRYMNDFRQANTLATYVRQGGLVWLAGGGAATAALINFDRGLNNNTQPKPATTTFRFTDNELIPGRFIYDQAHWRSEFKSFKLNGGTIKRYLGRFETNPGGNPDIHGYQTLPAVMEIKKPATDPFPPNRATTPTSVFYRTQLDIEFLSGANEILEDLNSGPLEDFQSTLDTLYKATASTLQPDTGRDALQSVVMTYYHGLDNTPLIVTGFPFWNYQRKNCKELTDFVLQKLWRFRRPMPAATTFSSSPGRTGSLATGPQRVWGAPVRPGATVERQAPRDARPESPAAGGPRD